MKIVDTPSGIAWTCSSSLGPLGTGHLPVRWLHGACENTVAFDLMQTKIGDVPR